MVAYVAKPLLLAVLWTLSAGLSAAFTRHGDGLATIWPANAILTVYLLLAPRSRHAAYLGVVGLGAIPFYLWNGASLLVALAFSIANVAEAALAAGLIARLSPVGRLFDGPANLFRFALAAFLASGPSALAIGLVMHTSYGADWGEISAGWAATHGCGLLITVPLLLILNDALREIRTERARIKPLISATAMLGLVAATSVLVFFQSTFVLSFLIVPALLVPTFRLRASGAAASVMIIASIASWFTIEGSGPFAMMPVSPAERVYVMQFFIATMFLCALPIAAVLDERDELVARTEAHLASMHRIADRIGDALFQIDEADNWAYLNPAYQAITGHSVASALGRPMLADLPERDHARINHALARLRSGRIQQYSFTTQLEDAVGATRYLEFTLHAGSFSGLSDEISGVFRDVTARTLLDMQLRSSAHSARRDARTDQLTTLPNRRAFFEQLEARLQSGEAMALALFDIDRFKRINDAFGHIAGDAVLRHIALAAAAQLRGGDLLARIGGEEFALLIEDSDPDAAVAAAERLIATIAAQPMTLPPELTGSPDEARLSVTISMGLARRKAGQSAENLLAEADRALYAAKNGGRNQLKLAA